MPVSFKVWIGLIVVGVGVGGLVYTMPRFSNSVASKGPVFSEADVPHISDSARAYIPLEAASAALIAIGVAIAALGHADTFSKSSRKDIEKVKDSKTRVAGAA
jgi:hypothetical protein